MGDLTVNRFRAARGRVLARQISVLAQRLQRDITILDVGGRKEYWDNASLKYVREIRILNNDPAEFKREETADVFKYVMGDATDLSEYKDKSIDLVHSNSVIEHVGAWPEMCAMADEVRRVGISGWVQTPAWEFPIEPHFKLPFVHWFGSPVRRGALAFSPPYRRLPLKEKRWHIDRINLVSYREFQELFPGCEIFIERLVLAKSYTARWQPG